MSDVLVVAEHRDGALRDVSFEVLTAGRELADSTGGDLHMAVINGDVEQFAEELSIEGVDVIHTFEHGGEFQHNVYEQILKQLHATLDPQYLVVPHTVNGLDYVPALGEALQLPIVTDVVDMDLDEDELVVHREMYSGKVETTVEVPGSAAVVTIRPGEWPAADGAGAVRIESIDASIDEDAIGSTVLGYEAVAAGDVDITDADVLVSVGRGIEEEENLALIHDLADALDATVSASRPIVDSGWLPKNRQVGQSGKVVTPSVYIAIGISGAVQHVAGMKGAETIIAINTDPNAPIMDIADYAIQDDLFDTVPALTEEFE